jgi:hypothetical protein
MPPNEVGPRDTTPEGTDNTTNTSHREEASPHEFSNSSQQVSWWEVHELVGAVLNQVNDWPMLGTPAWCGLTHDDPRKWAALLDGAQHWALRVDTCQAAMAEASRDISAAADWPAIAPEIRQRNEFYAQKPYLKRAAS